MDIKKRMDEEFGAGTYDRLEVIYNLLYDIGLSPDERHYIYLAISQRLTCPKRKRRLRARKFKSKAVTIAEFRELAK